MKKFFFSLSIAALFVLLQGCSGTKQVTNVLVYRAPYAGDVAIKGIGETIPENAVLLGSVSVGEAGFTKTKDCTYQAVISDARRLAAGMGGNTIVITEHKEPSEWTTTCHRIKANVYLVPENQ